MLRLVDRSPRAAAYLGAQWLPYVTELPGFEMMVGFDGQRFGASPSPQIGALAFALAPEIRAAAGWVWRDTAVTIRQAGWPAGGGNPADGDFQIVWQGNAGGISVSEGVARVELIDRGQLLRVPVAPLRFGSTGIALLDAAAAARDRQAGAVVPVAFGQVLTLPGLLVDRLNNVWLFAAQPAASVQAFYDGGAAFTLGTARASLAALQGAAPAGGTVDWCLDAAGLLLARPADRPVYPFTCDATFGSTALGDIASAIVGGRLTFRAGVVAALNGLGLGACGLYVDDEASVAEALDRLLAGLGIIWKVRADGTVDARRAAWSAPISNFAAHQRHAPSRQQIILPTARRQLGYAWNNRVHGEGELARILLAENLAYADGTPVQDLQPATPGADATPDVLPTLPQGEWGVGQDFVTGKITQDRAAAYVAKQDHTAALVNRPPAADFWALWSPAADGTASRTVFAVLTDLGYSTAAEFGVRVGAGGTVELSASCTFENLSISPSSNQLQLLWQRLSGATWVDVGASATSASVAPGATGSLVLSRTFTGTAGDLVQFRLRAARIGPAFVPDTAEHTLSVNGISTGAGA